MSKDDKEIKLLSFAIKNKSYYTSRDFLVVMSNLLLFFTWFLVRHVVDWYLSTQKKFVNYLFIYYYLLENEILNLDFEKHKRIVLFEKAKSLLLWSHKYVNLHEGLLKSIAIEDKEWGIINQLIFQALPTNQLKTWPLV